MEAYQVRLIKEFEDVYTRFKKLFAFVKTIDNKSYNYDTPLELFLEQLDVMFRYLEILQKRFDYEGIANEVPIQTIKERVEKEIAEFQNERIFK